MLGRLVLVFFAVPLAELGVLIWVGGRIGLVETLVLLVVVSVVGAALAKQQGVWVVSRIRAELDAGRVPGPQLVDALLIFAAALLLLTPGFLTDVVAIALLLPPARAVVRELLRRRFDSAIRTGSTRAWMVDRP